MSSIMYGKDRNKEYELGQKIKAGGEGTVYSVVGHPGLVAKIYNSERLSDQSLMKSTENKILAMLNMNFDPRINGKLIVAWPTDTLYDLYGNFVGYVMPKVDNMKSLVWAMRPSDRDVLWPKGYRWRYSIAIAYNLSCVMEKLHASGIVVGDMNTNNILIDSTGNVVIIDAGSFNIRTKEGQLYKCIVGFPEVLAPELQGKDLTKPYNQFTDRTDCFALAIHIFTLLNNNCHPFGCLNYTSDHASSSSPKIMDNIIRGFCPYVKGKEENTVEDSLGMAAFSNDINALFKRTFNYDAATAVKESTIFSRPSAKEWREVLGEFYDVGFNSCSKNPLHEFSKNYNGGCPWCAIEYKKKNNTGPGVGTKTGTKTGVGTAAPPVKHKLIPIVYCDQDGNTLSTSQIEVEYGKTDFAYAIDIQGYHLVGNNTRREISVDQNGQASLSEIRFSYEKVEEKKKEKHHYFRFFFIMAILYCLVAYGMIEGRVKNQDYKQALEFMDMFPFYNELFPDEYNSVRNKVTYAEKQREAQKHKDNYESAIQYYRSGDYSKAYNLFNSLSSSYEHTSLYLTFCKAHLYTASDYFSTIYDNMFFEDGRDLLAMNSDMFAAYMKGNWHYYENGGGTVTMGSDLMVYDMPEGPGSNYYWSVKNGRWKYSKDNISFTDYFTIEIYSSTLFVLHPIHNNVEYWLFKD